MSNTVKMTQKNLGLAAAGLLLAGGVAGAGAMKLTRPAVEMAPMIPVPIARVAQTSGPITLRGRVTESYGSKFVLQDASGRTLIDLGPRGEGGSLVSAGAVETVQGRYERGFVRASFLVDAAGNVTALGPIGASPHHGPHGPRLAGEHEGALPPGGLEGGPPQEAETPPPPATAQPAPPPAAAAPAVNHTQ